jgi:hypothetical protein
MVYYCVRIFVSLCVLYIEIRVKLGMNITKKSGARHPWLMPLVLTTQEAEIRGIAI